MITSEFVRTMARYNRWQNQSLFEAADGLEDTARREDRGAFFGSIHGTLSHLLWGDTIWMSRFADWAKPEVGIPGSAEWVGDWNALSAGRREADDRIVAWADAMDEERLSGDLTWFSGAIGREVSKPLAFCIAHFFNHQTHHRGQVHAMLTAAGARPSDTDLFILPEDA
ncbi:MAG: DinB family protein [Paracoccaceae bacterium]|nr:DinB family protein [Paracoccaceae bacterium]